MFKRVFIIFLVIFFSQQVVSGNKRYTLESERVNVEQLDSICEKEGITNDLLKWDVVSKNKLMYCDGSEEDVMFIYSVKIHNKCLKYKKEISEDILD